MNTIEQNRVVAGLQPNTVALKIIFEAKGMKEVTFKFIQHPSQVIFHHTRLQYKVDAMPTGMKLEIIRNVKQFAKRYSLFVLVEDNSKCKS